MDPKIIALYDEYTHAPLPRRTFLERLAALAGSSAAAYALLPMLENDYARAAIVAPDDARIAVERAPIRLPGGEMRAYVAVPRDGPAKRAGVIVIHENRGLNPYIEDVARRAAAEGFLALAPDGLFPVGGYPGNDDDGRTLQAGLDQAKLRTDMLNSARWLKGHRLSSGKLGVTGFCWGGGTTNFLAASLGDEMHAGAPFYGAAAETAGVARITAPLLVHYAETDERINAMWPAFEAALKQHGVPHEAHFYPGTQHGFHNNSTPRYQEAAAKLAWERTVAHFRRRLG